MVISFFFIAVPHKKNPYCLSILIRLSQEGKEVVTVRF